MASPAAKKADAKAVTDAAKPVAVTSAPEPEPAVVDFDPKAVNPKQGAKLKIDASLMPAGLNYTIEMNGKVYFRKTSGGTQW